jgi:hypothetical protein
MRPTAFVEARLGPKRAAQFAVGLGIVALVAEHGADPGHDREGTQEQALEQDRVVDVGRGGGAGHRHAVPVHRDMVLGAPLAPIRRVRAGEVAAAFGAHGACIEDQVGMAAQHADQQGVHLRQQARPRPPHQAAAQGRAAGLVLGGDQAAPWRALAQEAPQRRHHPDGLGWWVARPAARQVVVAGVDHRGDEMQELEIQC